MRVGEGGSVRGDMAISSEGLLLLLLKLLTFQLHDIVSINITLALRQPQQIQQ